MSDLGSDAGGSCADAPIDLDWLSECTDSDTAEMRKLLDTYFNRTAVLLGELDTAVAAGNAGEVKRIGHACAGSSGICGMRKLEPLFRELERAGTAGEVDGAAATTASVHSEYQRAKAFYDHMFAE